MNSPQLFSYDQPTPDTLYTTATPFCQNNPYWWSYMEYGFGRFTCNKIRHPPLYWWIVKTWLNKDLRSS